MNNKPDPYVLRVNSTCPQCGRPAELHIYPAAKNRGHGSREYFHKVRRGFAGMREVMESCTLPE